MLPILLQSWVANPSSAIFTTLGVDAASIVGIRKSGCSARHLSSRPIEAHDVVVEDVVAAVAHHEPHRLGAVGVVRRAGDVVADLGHLSPNWVEASTHLIAQSAQWYRFTVTLSPSPVRSLRTRAPSTPAMGHRGVPIPDRCRPVDGLEVIGLRQRGEEAAASTIGRGVESPCYRAQDRIPHGRASAPRRGGMAHAPLRSRDRASLGHCRENSS